MRRVAALGALSLALLSPACAGAERPEGVVERWLVSLNQGEAGAPERYVIEGTDARILGDRVVEGWREAEPGELDRIEVGLAGPVVAAVPGETDTLNACAEGGCTPVRFRVVDLDGRETRGIAYLGLVDGGYRIADVRTPDLAQGVFAADVNSTLPALPSDGGPTIDGLGVAPLAVAVLAAALLTLVAVLVVRLVRVPERELM